VPARRGAVVLVAVRDALGCGSTRNGVGALSSMDLAPVACNADVVLVGVTAASAAGEGRTAADAGPVTTRAPPCGAAVPGADAIEGGAATGGGAAGWGDVVAGAVCVPVGAGAGIAVEAAACAGAGAGAGAGTAAGGGAADGAGRGGSRPSGST
jgi:hypothetical protein